MVNVLRNTSHHMTVFNGLWWLNICFHWIKMLILIWLKITLMINDFWDDDDVLNWILVVMGQLMVHVNDLQVLFHLLMVIYHGIMVFFHILGMLKYVYVIMRFKICQMFLL